MLIGFIITSKQIEVENPAMNQTKGNFKGFPMVIYFFYVLMCLGQIIFRNVRTLLFLNSFIQDFIANFRITCWVRLHPNADTLKYSFYQKVNVNEFAALQYLHILMMSLIFRVIVF